MDVFSLVYTDQILHATDKIPFHKSAFANYRNMPLESCGVIKLYYIMILYNAFYIKPILRATILIMKIDVLRHQESYA